MKLEFLILIFFLAFATVAVAQTVLKSGQTTFSSGGFVLENVTKSDYLLLYGSKEYLNILWNIYYSDIADADIAVMCYLNCDNQTTNCIGQQNCSYIGPAGRKLCTVVSPNYNYYQNNLAKCKFWNPSNESSFMYLNKTFKPVDFTASTSATISASVGRPFDLQINLKNAGLFNDTYRINFTQSSPIIYIENSLRSSETMKGSPDYDTGYVKSRIIASASTGNPAGILILVNSTEKPDISKELYVEIKAGYLSLPEYDWFGLLQIILIAAVIVAIKF